MVAGDLLWIVTIKLAAVNFFIAGAGGNEGDFAGKRTAVTGKILNHLTAEAVDDFALIGQPSGVFFAQNALGLKCVK